MKLYQTPGGTWAGSEKDWKAACKEEGTDPKTCARKIVEVPVDKAGLMEFLTLHSVNVISPARHRVVSQGSVAGNAPPPAPAADTTVPKSDLDALFEAAPLGQQLTLAAIACENAYKRIK